MKLSFKRQPKGYTLIETLVASAVMMLAIGAAASLSLSMVTQEEAAERSLRAANYLENAATLYRLGFETSAEIEAILPNEPAVSSLTVTPITDTVPIVGSVNLAEIQITFSPSGATNQISATEAEWTGGDNTAVRTQTVRVLRDDPN